MTDQISNLAYALKYASRGWPVLPLHTPDENGNCDCWDKDCGKNSGKHPRTMKGLKDATTDEAVIRRWWDMWPNANIAIVTGGLAGLSVLDVDPRHGGTESLSNLEEKFGPLPETLVSRTGGDGLHYFFSNSAEIVKNSQGKIGSGLDMKGEAGYIVAAPSLHKSGKRYEWVNEDVPIATLPDWLRRLNTAKKQKASTGALVRFESGVAFDGEDDFDDSSWSGVNAELKRRIMAHETASMQDDGWWHCKGICHDGDGDTAIMFSPASGAVQCMAGCSYGQLLVAFGLPEKPDVSDAVEEPSRIAVSWGEFAQTKLTEGEKVIFELERGEIGMLVASTNIGKTTLAMNLSLALAAGVKLQPLVDASESGRRVLYVDGETRAARFQWNINRMIQDWGNSERDLVEQNLHLACDSVIKGEPLNLSNTIHMKDFQRTVNRIQPDLIILDTLTALFTMGSENDNAEMSKRVMRPLSKLALEANAAILLTHHIGKQSEDAQAGTRAYRGRGASASGAAARLVLLMKPENNDGERVSLICAKSKGRRFEDVVLKLDHETRWFSWTNERPTRKPSRYSAIVDVVAQFGREVKRSEIEEALAGAVSKSQIGKLLSAAVDAGDLQSARFGWYVAKENAHLLSAVDIEHKDISNPTLNSAAPLTEALAH